MIAVHSRNAIMPREPFVDERVVRIQQIQSAPVLTHDACEQQFGFAAERLPEVIVEVWKQQQIRFHTVQVPELEPLPRESGYNRGGARVRDNPQHLSFEHTTLPPL